MIAIVDYGMGNLRSVQKGFEKAGAAATVTSDPADLLRASKIVLPGVGAFPDAMAELNRRRLVEPLRKILLADDRPFLGICLGLQLLFETGTEGGRHEGLGVLAGEVVRFELPREFKVPHMGWNRLDVRSTSPLTEGLSIEPYFYFVHSYYVVPRDASVAAGTADYGGPFAAWVRRGQLYASQFHPEKSQGDGLRILRNFAAL